MYMCVCMSSAYNLLTKWGSISFSRRTLLHGVIAYMHMQSLIFQSWKPASFTEVFLDFCHYLQANSVTIILSTTFQIPVLLPFMNIFPELWKLCDVCVWRSVVKWFKTLYFHINNVKAIFPFAVYALCIGGLLLTEPRENSPCGCVGFEEIPFRCEVTTPPRTAAPWDTAALCSFSYSTLYRLAKRKPHKRDVWFWSVRFVMVRCVYGFCLFLYDRYI